MFQLVQFDTKSVNNYLASYNIGHKYLLLSGPSIIRTSIILTLDYPVFVSTVSPKVKFTTRMRVNIFVLFAVLQKLAKKIPHMRALLVGISIKLSRMHLIFFLQDFVKPQYVRDGYHCNSCEQDQAQESCSFDREQAKNNRSVRFL